jgi:hypothetical protein
MACDLEELSIFEKRPDNFKGTVWAKLLVHIRSLGDLEHGTGGDILAMLSWF